MDEPRIEWTCPVCGDAVAVPDKGLGRAVLASFKTHHQHDKDKGDNDNG